MLRRKCGCRSSNLFLVAYYLPICKKATKQTHKKQDMNTRTHSRMYALTHACMHMHAYTHARTHTHALIHRPTTFTREGTSLLDGILKRD